MNYDYEPLINEFEITWAIDIYDNLEQEKQPLRNDPWDEPDEEDQYKFEGWQRTEKEKIKNLYKKEIDNLEKKKEYFFGCSLSNYTHNYNSRLTDFTDKFKDTYEIDFIKEELDKGIFEIPYHREYIFDHQIKQFNFSLSKRFDFLKTRAELLNYHISYIEARFEGYQFKESYKVEPLETTINNNITPLKWEGYQTELIELIKALILTGKVKGLQKDIINNFTQFFQIEIKNPDKLITDLAKRNTGSETLFLDQLKKALYDHIQKN